MTRYLRIAGAVAFALLACVMIGLWIRSYSWSEGVNGPISDHYFAGIEHCYGLVICDLSRWDELPCEEWRHPIQSAESLESAIVYWKSETALGLGFLFNARAANGFGMSFPHWFLAATSIALAAVLAFKRSWRFSIRSILIATTLLAVALGLGVYLL
jgi:hypothetical protein